MNHALGFYVSLKLYILKNTLWSNASLKLQKISVNPARVTAMQILRQALVQMELPAILF